MYKNMDYTYADIELWDLNKWKDKRSSIYDLVQCIGVWEEQRETTYVVPEELAKMDPEERHKMKEYDPKGCVFADPVQIKKWYDKGVNYDCREMGGSRWITFLPVETHIKRDKKLPLMLVMHKEDYEDEFWPMKLMERFADYLEHVAAGEMGIIFVISNNEPDIRMKYVGMLQECVLLNPIDHNRVYIDLDAVYSTGHTLKDVEGFKYKDDNGNIVEDPDSAVEDFFGFKVLDISGRWVNRNSNMAQYLMEYNPAVDYVDRDRIIHSTYGEMMMDGIRLEYKYDDPMDPELVKYWRDRGVEYKIHDIELGRWMSMAPTCANSCPDVKLPIMVVMYETNYTNPHLFIKCFSSYHEYGRMAGQGDCVVVFFALEDMDSNDALVDILDDLENMYPVDRRRVYITGHSHNGMFSRMFMCRHPDLITAVATLGNKSGFEDWDTAGFPAVVDEADVEIMEKIEIPIINIGTFTEIERGDTGGRLPFEKWAKSYQRRLRALNCPMKTIEEIDAAKYSDDKVISRLGIPADKAELAYIGGLEHYIVDVKNNQGKWWLRQVAIENFMHMPLPSMALVSWEFLRRFARDPETKKIIEL